jgi:dihydrofolate synthase/folylpolyglutamate synthase
VVSVLEDKDAAGMLRPLLPGFDHAIFTRCSNPRSLPPATLESLAGQLGGPESRVVADPRAAVDEARTLAGAEGAVVATGSIYLVADLVREIADSRASTL